MFALFTKLNTACCQLETPARNSCWTCYIYIIEVQLNYTLRTSPLILKKQCLFILKLHYSNPVKADTFHLIMNLITGCELHTQNIRLNGFMWWWRTNNILWIHDTLSLVSCALADSINIFHSYHRSVVWPWINTKCRL